MKRRKPERELTDEERNVVYAVRHCAGDLNDILQGARRKAEINAKLFAETGVSVMFRGIDAYARMYEKLGLKSREGLDRLFTKFSECEEVQDTEDAIAETEGNWRDFLSNLDRDVIREEADSKSPISAMGKEIATPKCKYFLSSEYPLIDMHTNKEITLNDFTSRNTCVLVTFQPAFWPDAAVRWRHSEVAKVKADLSQFGIGFLIVTWGPPDEVRRWAKAIGRATKWPVLWDKTNSLCTLFGFNSGLHRIWTAENLDFLGCQRAMFSRPINPPPTDLDCLKWRQIGGEAVLSKPRSWDPNISKSETHKTDEKSCASSDKNENDFSDQDNSSTRPQAMQRESQRDGEAIKANETKVCYLHQSSYLADLMPSGAIYQAALTCYARAHNTTEALVMDHIRQNRRFSTAPESDRLQYEETSGLYYDPETALYYDPSRGYFYDSSDQMYYYWSQSEYRYIPANALIQAEMVAAQAAQATAAHVAIGRAISEREAARQAAARVVAQLAEIRASKDDYAAYAYATCVIPQQEQNFAQQNKVGSSNEIIKAIYKNTAAAADNIRTSLNSWDVVAAKPLVPYADDPPGIEPIHRESNTPPPPGL